MLWFVRNFAQFVVFVPFRQYKFILEKVAQKKRLKTVIMTIDLTPYMGYTKQALRQKYNILFLTKNKYQDCNFL